MTAVVRAGGQRYRVKMEAGKRMRKVVRKMAQRVGRRVEEVRLVVEASGREVAGEERMGEVGGAVFVLKTVD